MWCFAIKRSGSGEVVAEGFQDRDGTVTVRVLGSQPSTLTWRTFALAMAVHGHGHGGLAYAEWVD